MLYDEANLSEHRIDDRLPAGAAEEDGLALDLLDVGRLLALRKAKSNTSNAPMCPTEAKGMPCSRPSKNTSGEGKPNSAWPWPVARRHQTITTLPTRRYRWAV
jgi:hypothetical protein